MLHRVPAHTIPAREDQIKNEPMRFSASLEFALRNGGDLTRAVISKLAQRGKISEGEHVVTRHPRPHAQARVDTRDWRVVLRCDWSSSTVNRRRGYRATRR